VTGTVHARKTGDSVRCIFTEKLVFEKGKDATPIFTEPVQLIISISGVLGRSKKKQEVIFDLLCLWVPRVGL